MYKVEISISESTSLVLNIFFIALFMTELPSSFWCTSSLSPLLIVFFCLVLMRFLVYCTLEVPVFLLFIEIAYNQLPGFWSQGNRFQKRKRIRDTHTMRGWELSPPFPVCFSGGVGKPRMCLSSTVWRTQMARTMAVEIYKQLRPPYSLGQPVPCPKTSFLEVTPGAVPCETALEACIQTAQPEPLSSLLRELSQVPCS